MSTPNQPSQECIDSQIQSDGKQNYKTMNEVRAVLRFTDVRASSAANIDNQSNADLYAAGLPVYTQRVSDDEVSIDAESIREDKPLATEGKYSSSVPVNDGRRGLHPTPGLPGRTTSREWEHSEQTSPTRVPSAMGSATGHYLTEPVTKAALVGVRPCSILLDRPAIWLVKGRKTALSPFAAAVLVEEGLIMPQNLELSVNNPFLQTEC